VLDGMASLAAQSLIGQTAGPDGEPRFTMLETIREFGLEQLEVTSETSAAWRRHSDWYLTFAARVSAELRGPRQADLFDLLAVEHGNLRSSFEWSTTEADGAGAATLAQNLAWFWVIRGHLREGRVRLDRLIARAPDQGPVRATILSVAGFLAERQGEYASAEPLLEEALRLWRALENDRGVATVLWSLRVVAAARGDADRASALLHECVALFRQGGPETPFNAVIAGYAESPIGSLAALAQQQGDYGASQILYDEDLALAGARGDSHGVANALRGLGSLACYRRDLARAADLLEQSLRRFRSLRDIPCVGINLSWLAVVASARDQRERAALLFAAADVLRQRSGIGLPASVRAVHDRSRAQVRSAMGENAFEAASADGRSMSLEQIVAYALDEPPPA
jgi:tetratricopeptide (TPR) repeat protein